MKGSPQKTFPIVFSFLLFRHNLNCLAATICGNDSLYCTGDSLTELPFDNIVTTGLRRTCEEYLADVRPPSALLHNIDQFTMALRKHTIGDLSLYRLGTFDLSNESILENTYVKRWEDFGKSTFYNEADSPDEKSIESKRHLKFGPAIAANESTVIFSAVDGYVGFASNPRQTSVYYNYLERTAFFKHNKLLISDNAAGAITRIVSSVQLPDQQDVAYVAATLFDNTGNRLIRLYKYEISNDRWSAVSDFPTDKKINGAAFLPMSEKGIIIYFLQPTMREVLIFDIGSNKWHTQVVNTGDVPKYREGPCVVSTSALDGSSHQIHVHGGASAMANDTHPASFAYDNHYILTVPALQWIKAPSLGPIGSHAACGLYKDRKLLLYGGFRLEGEKPIDCNAQLTMLDLSTLEITQNLKDEEYFVPEVVKNIIRDHTTGCIDTVIPSSVNMELSASLKKSYALREFKARSLENCHSKGDALGKSGLKSGQIVGVVVGILAFLAVIAVIVWLCCRGRPPAITEIDPANCEVLWVCALSFELEAATHFLDGRYSPMEAERVIYRLGKMDKFYVAIGCLPADNYGTAQASRLVSAARTTFPNLRYILVVGIGGGAPGIGVDIRLGDVVVGSGGVFAHGVVKMVTCPITKGTKVEHTQNGFINPPMYLLNLINQSKDSPDFKNDFITATGDARVPEQFGRPSDTDPDRLHLAETTHQSHSCCDKANESVLVARDPPNRPTPEIHYGAIGSADQLIKDATIRDKLSQKFKILAFETEAAGIGKTDHCLVIRGISDYADSHKNDIWRRYAAFTAAAYTKLLITRMDKRSFPDSARKGLTQ